MDGDEFAVVLANSGTIDHVAAIGGGAWWLRRASLEADAPDADAPRD